MQDVGQTRLRQWLSRYHYGLQHMVMTGHANPLERMMRGGASAQC